MVLRTSVSDRVVSSKPGVSSKVMRRPCNSKVSEHSMMAVQDARSWPTARVDPLARFINCGS